MARELSNTTVLVLRLLWSLPWASAADIALITGLKVQTVSNVLNRRMEKGWLEREKLGRTQEAVLRYVFTSEGVTECHSLYGWKIFWWHSANGVLALARRLEVVEMCYTYLPRLWQSNLVDDDRRCWVFRERQETNERTGQPMTRCDMREADWSGGRLIEFHWMDQGPVEAIAAYDDGRGSDDVLLIPVLWRGNFQKPADIASVREDMERVLVEDQRRWSVDWRQWRPHEYCPGVVVLCPDRVSGALVQRNWISFSSGHAVRPGIISADGQVIRRMETPTALWWDFHLPRHGLDVTDVKDVSRVVNRMRSGAYAAVNGLRSWRLFRAIDGSPGVNIEQIADYVAGDTTVARVLRKPMTEGKVLVVRAGGHYLDAAGRGLLAYSQRVTPSRVLKRWGIYTRKGGEYRRRQRLHNQGQAEVIRWMRKHGFRAFPAMGVVIEYRHKGRLIRVVPDAFVILPPGVLVAVEFERTAETLGALGKKANNYDLMASAGKPLPVLFVTETPEAAETLAGLGYRYVLAATLDEVRNGPHGDAVGQDGPGSATPGCWRGLDPVRGVVVHGAPINLWAHSYVRSEENQEWRLPLDRPFGGPRKYFTMGGKKIYVD